jgi:hypothetical protein
MKYASEIASRSISGEFAAKIQCLEQASRLVTTRFAEDVRAYFSAQNRLDFCRKARIATRVGRWTSPPAGALRARPAMCGALGRASVNSDAGNQRSPRPCRSFPLRSPGTPTAPHPRREAPNRIRLLGARSRPLRPTPRLRRRLQGLSPLLELAPYTPDIFVSGIPK